MLQEKDEHLHQRVRSLALKNKRRHQKSDETFC